MSEKNLKSKEQIHDMGDTIKRRIKFIMTSKIFIILFKHNIALTIFFAFKSNSYLFY